jgi:hypothetical protein
VRAGADHQVTRCAAFVTLICDSFLRLIVPGIFLIANHRPQGWAAGLSMGVRRRSRGRNFF